MSFLAVVIASVLFLFFILLYTQFMLTLILIDVQYLQNVVFSFEKSLNDQNHLSSDSYHSIKKSPQQKFSFPPLGVFPLLLKAI